MESEGVLALAVPEPGVTTWVLLKGALGPSSAPGNPFPPTAIKKSDHISRKQLYEQTSKANQSKPKIRSRSNADQNRLGKSRYYLEKRLAKNYDVRYNNPLRSYFDKFIESSKDTACNQLECPSLQTRLHHHRNQHHSLDQEKEKSERVAENCCRDQRHEKCRAPNQPCCKKDTTTKDVPRRSPNGYTKKFTPSEENKENHSVQTKITFADLGNITISIEPEGIPASKSDVETDKTEHLELMDAHNSGQEQSRTRSNVECDKTEYLYKDNLKDEINKWILYVPFHPNTTPEAQLKKDNTINNLLERICDLVTEVDNPNYQQMIAYEIYQCLDDLNIWYPGAKENQSLFKEGLCLNLWISIKDVNDKWLGYRIYSSQQSKRQTNCDVNNCRTWKTCDDESINYTIKSQGICDSKVKTKKGNCSRKNISCKDYLNREISDWLIKSNLYRPGSSGMSKRIITNIFLNRLQPYLNEPMTDKNKNALRSKIIEILEDLPTSLNCPGNTDLLTKFANDLTNRLLWIRAKFECNKCKKCGDRTNLQCITQKPKETKNIVMQDFLGDLRDCLTNSSLGNQKVVEEEILNIIFDNMESIRIGKVQDVESDIRILLHKFGELTHAEMANIVKCVVDNVKNIVLLDADDIILQNTDTTSLLKPCNSAILSIYTSKNDLVRLFDSPVNSDKSLKQQASEKNTHVNKVRNIIKNWVGRLPQKTKTDEKHKKTMIDELIEAITDQTVLEQIAIEQKTDKHSAQKYLINQFLTNLNLAEDNEIEHHVLELLNKLNEISTTARSLLNYHDCETSCSLEYFLSKTRVRLPDVITTWVNEQSSQIYSNDDTEYRNRKIQELTAKLQPLLENNNPDKEKSLAIAEWLREILKDHDNIKINAMAVNLTERLKKLHLEETPAVQAKLFADQEHLLTASDKIKKIILTLAINKSTSYPNTLDTCNKDPDETIKQFIIKFIQHNSDVEDITARRAFAELLETEIEKLSAPSRKELYDGFLKSPQNYFSPIRLDRELKYIKDITDWLKNIPVESTYNARGNKKRIDFCLSLAGDLASVESERLHHDDDNSNNLKGIIGQYMTQLPIHPNQRANINLMIHQLLNKIISRRQKFAAAEANYALTNPHPNLIDFIEDYIRINGREIAEDDLKVEGWSDRLLKEVKQIICVHDPVAFTKTGVYHRLAEQKAEDTVKDFNIKLAYAEEISDWMKNLPLLHTMDEKRPHLIKELAEKIAETKTKKAFNPNDVQIDVELENYIVNWISKLPLDRTKEVILPIVIKQLINRVEKVNMTNSSIDNVIGVPKTGCCSSRTARVNSPSPSSTRSNLSNSSSKKSSKVKVIGDSKIECCSSRTARVNSVSKSPKSQGIPGQHHPASWIVKSVEDWTGNLPIEGSDEKDIKAVKNDIAKKLYQKMGELNVNQRFYKDIVLYNDVISDEIDAQLEKLPRNMIFKGDKNQIKKGLLQIIADSKRKINEKTAGEIYKHRLENTIESSMPQPLQIQKQDLGFELYKNRLASMFILENFDHGNEVSKHKYEKQLKREIDKYFKNAQSKNAILLTKDQIYNELYRSLYKVPTPNKTSLIEEVEEIKMKCEVDDWFEELPLGRPAEVSELLEWDQIRSTLAKRLHEMENDPNPTDNKHKERTKWLSKLPIQPGKDIDEVANKLEIKLESSAKERASPFPCDTKCAANCIFNNEDYPNSYDNSRNISANPITKKSADLTIEIIEDWCSQLPIPINTNLKGGLVTKIIIKVSELNSDPGIFNDDLLYNHLLDKELDKILSTLPDTSDLRRSKDERKSKLIKVLDSIKVVIREERARHEYRNDLNDTVKNVLEISTCNTAEKTALFNNFRDKVVDDFIEYYHRDDDAGKHFFKKKILYTMTEFMHKIKDDKDRSVPFDSMVKGNQLLCELSKVPLPSEAAVEEEIQEIRMKKQVREFFDATLKDSKDKKGLRNQVQTSLAKRLNEIEKTGHNIESDEKVKTEITRSLRKLGHEISSQKIDTFIQKLKAHEMTRKTPLVRKYDSYPAHSNIPNWVNDSVIKSQKKKCCNRPNCERSRKIQEQIDQTLRTLLNFSNALQQLPRSPGDPGPSDQARALADHQKPGSTSEQFISGSPRQPAPQCNEPVGNNSPRSTRFVDSISPLAQTGSNVSGSLRDYSQFDDEVARSPSEIHFQGSFQPQATSETFQRSLSSPGSRDLSRGGEWQQSIGPSDGSGTQWQSRNEISGHDQSSFVPPSDFELQGTDQGIAQSSRRLFPPQALETSASPYTSSGQQSISSPLWQQEAGRAGGQKTGPVSAGNSQSQSHKKITWHDQNSFLPSDAGVVPRRLSLGGQQESIGPEPGSDAQWQSLYSTIGPPQLGTDQGVAQSSRRLFPPQALETSTSPYTSSDQQPLSGQQESFGPETGSDAQWQSLYSTIGPQQLRTDQTGARLVPPKDLEMSTSPYATRLYPPRGLETSVSPYAIGPSGQRSPMPRQWGYHEPYVDPQSSSNVVYGPKTQGGVVDYLRDSALGYPGFVNEIPLSSSRLDQFSRSFQPPRGMPMQNQSAVSAVGQSFGQVGGQWEPRGPARQYPPRIVSNTMHPSGGSVQAWNTQSSAGPQAVQQRAQAMVHEQRYTMGPQSQDQILHDPYVSRQFDPGDVQTLQRFRGDQASLGQSGVEYQGFQVAGPISSSLRQSLAPSQRTLSGFQGISPISAQRSIIRGAVSPSSMVQHPSPGQAYQTQIPLIRSPQSTPSLPQTPQGSYYSPGPAMHDPGPTYVDSTLMGPYLTSPASVPLITPGESRQKGVSQDDVILDSNCTCERQMRAHRSRPTRPIHAIPLLEFCESCQDFVPFFRPIPYPGYFF